MSHISEAIPTYILTRDDLVPTPYAVGSLTEAVTHEPRGVYTVARTFHGDHALLLDAHLDRLEESARLVGIPLTLDRARLRSALRDLLHRAGYPEAKFRITVPRDEPDRVYLALELYQPVPGDVLKHGAHVATLPLVRENPVAKMTDWMTTRQSAVKNLPPGVYEGVLVSGDGRLLEGLSSNFYGVLHGVLRTAGDGVLAGITRRAILTTAPAIVPVELRALSLDDLPGLSEAMITSSGRGVVPVTMIDGQPIGTGEVGPVVAGIRQLYEDWTERTSEPI